jgi:hypothetical protein
MLKASFARSQAVSDEFYAGPGNGVPPTRRFGNAQKFGTTYHGGFPIDRCTGRWEIGASLLPRFRRLFGLSTSFAFNYGRPAHNGSIGGPRARVRINSRIMSFSHPKINTPPTRFGIVSCEKVT